MELSNEKAISSTAESARSRLEKQNKELRQYQFELEEAARKNNANLISTLEFKVQKPSAHYCLVTMLQIFIHFFTIVTQ